MNTAPLEIAASVAAPVVISTGVAAGKSAPQSRSAIVEERRQPAGQPEISEVVGLSTVRCDELHQRRRERALRAGLQHRHHRHDADEDAGEQDRDLLDRAPGKAVRLAMREARPCRASERHRDHGQAATRSGIDRGAENGEPTTPASMWC